VAHPAVVTPTVQREGVDARISTLVTHDLPVLVASTKIVGELPDFAVTVEQPRRRFYFALGLGEQSRNKTLADAALAARDENPTLHAVRSSASKTLLSLPRESCDTGTWLVVFLVCRAFAGFAFELLDVCAISCTD